MIPSLEQLRAGGKPALARALALAEARLDDPEVAALLDLAAGNGEAATLGVTGPPGVGKSSLISALIRRFRSDGLRVGVLAVDPSSKRSGGAVLGDRARFDVDPEDKGVYVRSMAARARLGGLAHETFAALSLMRAVVDRVIVETVGVGQSETDVTQVSDVVLLCIQPGSGDSLQYMKAGIAEVPDLAVVTKADLGALAEQARADLEAAWQLVEAGSPAVVLVSATTGAGLDELVGLIDRRFRQLDRQTARRAAQHRWWAEALLRTRYGEAGLRQVRGRLDEQAAQQPFQAVLAASALLEARLSHRPG